MKGSLDRWVMLVIVANILVSAVLLVAVVVDRIGSGAPGHPAQSGPASASASAELMPMGLAHIPTSNACVLCHESGGSAGVKVIPAIGHPLEGWRECTVCHTDEKLGRTAPGHDGIAQTECLNCHKEAPAGPTITQPHSRLQNQHCLDCHGDFVHLPSSMAGRNEDECSLCHKPTQLPPPAYPHPAEARLTCRTCHQSAEVGGLPIDHALRKDDTCLLCHEIKEAAPSASPSGSPGRSPLPSPITGLAPGR